MPRRAIDRRPALVLAAGQAVDHPSAAVNIAALISPVAANPAAQILNAADPDAPNVLAMSRAVAAMGHAWSEVILDPTDSAHVTNGLGATPWDTPYPIVLGTRAADTLGYEPVGDYATTIAEEVQWLIRAADGGPEADLLPRPDDPFFARFLDYTAEDAYLANPPAPRRPAR